MMDQYAPEDDEPAKRFVVWQTGMDLHGTTKDVPMKRLAEYDTIEEVENYPYRLDLGYKIQLGNKFLSRREFDDWKKKSHKQRVT
jgi:hypothetical protein